MDVSGRKGWKRPKDPILPKCRLITISGSPGPEVLSGLAEDVPLSVTVKAPTRELSVLSGKRGVTLYSSCAKTLVDDSSIFENPNLRVLHIYHGGRDFPLRLSGTPGVEDVLCWERRTGLESVQGLQRLRKLNLHLFRKTTDLLWLRDLPQLWQLELSGDGQSLSLSGIMTRLPSLMSLTLINFKLDDLGDLGSDRAENLRNLNIQNVGPSVDLRGLIGTSVRWALVDRVQSVSNIEKLKRTIGFLQVDHVDDEPSVPAPHPSPEQLLRIEGTKTESELFMDTDVPGAAALESTPYESTGFFWQSILAYLVAQEEPKLHGRYEEDSESDTLGALASRRVAKKLHDLLEPYARDPQMLRTLLQEAAAAGHEFDT